MRRWRVCVGTVGLSRARSCVALLALTAGAFGCTGGGTASPPANPPAAQTASKASPPAEGPCALVTPAEAEALLQDTVRRPRPERPARTGSVQRSACFYRSPKGSIEIILNKFDTPAAAAERYVALRKMYPGHDTRDVSGIGDAAFWTRGQLVLKRGDVHLHIEVDFDDARGLKSFDDAAGVDALIVIEKRLAQTALDRIPATQES